VVIIQIISLAVVVFLGGQRRNWRAFFMDTHKSNQKQNRTLSGMRSEALDPSSGYWCHTYIIQQHGYKLNQKQNWTLSVYAKPWTRALDIDVILTAYSSMDTNQTRHRTELFQNAKRIPHQRSGFVWTIWFSFHKLINTSTRTANYSAWSSQTVLLRRWL
jgi:GR25 family glycosyltransferase involved in LPS biosynthesis